MLTTLTGFGDSAVLLPLAAVVFIWLFVARSRAASLWWVLALGIATVFAAVLKIYFFSCPLGGDLHSPSGHTALSVVVYGGIAVILAAERTVTWQHVAIGLAGAGVAIAIGVSRVLLGKHSTLEVIVGFLIGSGAVALFSIGYGRQAKKRDALAPLVVLVIAALALLHGRAFNLEQLFQSLSILLRVRALACGRS